MLSIKLYCLKCSPRNLSKISATFISQITSRFLLLIVKYHKIFETRQVPFQKFWKPTRNTYSCLYSSSWAAWRKIYLLWVDFFSFPTRKGVLNRSLRTLSEAYLGRCRTFMMRFFTTTFSQKNIIIDVWKGPKYVSKPWHLLHTTLWFSCCVAVYALKNASSWVEEGSDKIITIITIVN